MFTKQTEDKYERIINVFDAWKAVKVAGGAFIALMFLIVVFKSFQIVGAGERGILLNWGAVQDGTLGEGFHWKIPFMQKIVIMDVKTQKGEDDADSASKDLQTITTSIAINFHIDPSRANKLYQEVGTDYVDRIIAPAIQESVKAVTAQFTAEELITKRPVVKEDIKVFITQRLAQYNIVVDEFSITNFSFSAEFDKAIESKQTAVQDALRAKNELERVKTEAEKKVVQAQAEAERIRIQAESISKQGGAEYVRLKAIEKWDGKLPVQMIPGSTVPFINLEK